jgi:N utilization substance protein B
MEKTLAAAKLAAPGEAAPVRGSANEIEESDAREVFDAIAENFEAPPGARDVAWELVSRVCANSALLDDRIAARARNWRVSRMAAVDRNILRLGTYELGHTGTPAAVVMDEAVELARRYGADASPAFVNGILDALAGDLRSDSNPAGGAR